MVRQEDHVKTLRIDVRFCIPLLLPVQDHLSGLYKAGLPQNSESVDKVRRLTGALLWSI
jgi:hypothetical protein